MSRRRGQGSKVQRNSGAKAGAKQPDLLTEAEVTEKTATSLFLPGTNAKIEHMPVSDLMKQSHEGWQLRVEKVKLRGDLAQLCLIAEGLEAAAPPYTPLQMTQMPVVVNGHIYRHSNIIIAASLTSEQIPVIGATREDVQEVLKALARLEADIRQPNEEDEKRLLYEYYSDD